MRDLRHALRSLRRSPWYASTVVTVLGAGIALVTVALAIVDGVLFKPLPFAQPSELFVIQTGDRTHPSAPEQTVSYLEIDAWRRSVPGILMTGVSAAPSARRENPEREEWEASVDERFFEVIGRPPLIGGFRPEDFDWSFGSVEDGGAWQPMIISFRLWRTHYGADPAVLGRTIVSTERDGRVFGTRIVGVLPADFLFPVDAGAPQPDILVPISRAQQRLGERTRRAVVRVQPGVKATVIAERLRRVTPGSGPHGPEPGARAMAFGTPRLTPVEEHLGGDERPAFRLVTAAAALMLLLSCVNAAGLSAARNLERRRELALRRALGAGAWQITRAIGIEVAALAVAATGVGLLAARPLLVGTVELLPSTMALMKPPEIDGRIFGMMSALSALTILIVSLWPALVAARIQPESALTPLSAASTTRGRRSRFALVATQVALGFVLTGAAGLSLASFAAAWSTDAGFERDRMILIEAFPSRYQSSQDALEQLIAGQTILANVPGVREVAASSIRPLFSRRNAAGTTVVPQGWTGRLDDVAARKVTANFFDVMGLDLVAGRWPIPSEWSAGQPVAIVSRTAARRLWPDRDALGQSLVRPRPGRNPPPPAIVIGIVEDARYGALDASPIADIYLPNPMERGTVGIYFHARTDRDADEVLVGAVAALSTTGLRLEQAASHDNAMFAGLRHRALPAWLFGWLGIAAVVVLAAGIIGLLSMSVAQRTRELGIRVAIGASAGAIVRLLVREQLAPVAAGLAAGGLIAAWGARLVRAHLYGVQPYDPRVWGGIALTIVAVSLAGILIPAWRAARVDPVVALRAD